MTSGHSDEILEVKEARETLVDLTAEQADYLERLGRDLAGKTSSVWGREPVDGDDSVEPDERSVIRCTKTTNGAYRLRISNAVGVISIPGAILKVVPKIPLPHFLHIARRGFSSPRLGQDRITVDSFDLFWEVVANWCITSIEQVLNLGVVGD